MTNVVTSYTATNADGFVTVTVVHLNAMGSGVWIPAAVALALLAVLWWSRSRKSEPDSN